MEIIRIMTASEGGRIIDAGRSKDSSVTSGGLLKTERSWEGLDLPIIKPRDAIENEVCRRHNVVQ